MRLMRSDSARMQERYSNSAACSGGSAHHRVRSDRISDCTDLSCPRPIPAGAKSPACSRARSWAYNASSTEPSIQPSSTATSLSSIWSIAASRASMGRSSVFPRLLWKSSLLDALRFRFRLHLRPDGVRCVFTVAGGGIAREALRAPRWARAVRGAAACPGPGCGARSGGGRR